MTSSIVCLVVFAMIFSFFVSVIFGESPLLSGTLNSCAILIVAVIVSASYGLFGTFGEPSSLDHTTYYKVLSVTPIDGKSTIVVMRPGDGDAVPIQFATKVTADTNGLYTVVGSNPDNYNLAPVK